MKLNVESFGLDIPCPGCGKKIHETVGRLKSNPKLTCPGCGASVEVNTDKFFEGIKGAEKSLDDFGRSLSKLGK